MQDKIQILLRKINWKEEDDFLFEDAILEKIEVNKKKNTSTFFLNMRHILPISFFEIFQENLQNAFFPLKTEVVFTTSLQGEEEMKEYYFYFLEKYSEESPILRLLLSYPISIKGEKICIEVSNLAEKMKLDSMKSCLLENMKKAGFSVVFEIQINEQKEKEIQKEIEENLKVEIPALPSLKEPVKEEVKNDFKKKFTPKRQPLIIDTEDENVLIGSKIEGTVNRIDTVFTASKNVVIEGYLFADIDVRETKTDLRILTLKITDETDSIYGKIFVNSQEDCTHVLKNVKPGNWFRFKGEVKDDPFVHELTFTIRDINIAKHEVEIIIDDAEKKRVELHAHTFMSQMDGLVDPTTLVKQARKWKHRAIAITDHNGCQAFPDVFHAVEKINKGLEEGEEPFKAIYGTELTLIDDTIHIVLRENDSDLMENKYVVFDFETTGFNAGGGDSIIEVGAVLIYNGEIIDRFDELIDPGKPLSSKITEVTNITDEMLKGKPNEKDVIIRFIDWFKDYPMVAHNAKFDVSFLEMAYKKYDLGEFKNTVIDTLELSRALDNTFSRHSLSALVKRYEVPWDENAHHRADYDAEGTAYVFHKMLKKLINKNFEKISDLKKLVSKEEIHKYGRSYHVNILAKNRVGLKNLFKIISLANTKYLYKTPRILRSEIEKLREGLLIGSGCYESEVFIEARSKSGEELTNIINFYDYVEVQPIDCYDHLIEISDFKSRLEVIEHIKKMITESKEAGKIVVATGDVHHLTKKDKIYREIIVNQKVPGGGRHPLARNGITKIPSQHFRTTREMLLDFEFLDTSLAYEIVVENPNKIVDMVEEIEVIIDTGGIPFSPKIEKSVETVNELVYGKAKSLYGDPLPSLIEERINQELTGIIKGGFDVIYLIAQKLVKKSNDDGYLVGSRGSVGSSFVATMMGITEVNPLPPHYVCPTCKKSIFEQNGETLGSLYSSGFDLPDFLCPDCGSSMNKDGQDIPFATFLGFEADKVPDIDLNFSGDYQWKAHEYTKELFGVDNVYRAGTIGTVAEKTAFGFVKGYLEEHNILKRGAEVERLAMGCTGVKRTTGQHPGGIVVIPGYMDVFDFTPFQFPADDSTSLWRTTHFDYHAIDQDVLKLDILGHDDPTVLKMLGDLSGMDVNKIPLDDKDTMKIFSSPEVLGVTKEKIMCETGTLGIPEFGTPFTIGMLVDTRPKTFAELIKISGLSHGTDVWLGNAQDLIRNKVVEFKNVIGCRDDIMVYLMYNGLPPKRAFKIMEFVRKGKASKDPEGWKEYESEMKEAGIKDWYIDSCRKIKYMFPKAHATAYVTSAFRIAWFKVHKPIWYYTAYFSIRCMDFDIESMMKGYDAIKAKISEILAKGYEATNKEENTVEVLKLALEASARGIVFNSIDLLKSDSKNFVIVDDHTLIPPFRTIDGLGDTVAENIIQEREKGTFLSIEDLQKRAKISGTLIDKMRTMGILEGMDESSQLSLF